MAPLAAVWVWTPLGVTAPLEALVVGVFVPPPPAVGVFVPPPPLAMGVFDAPPPPFAIGAFVPPPLVVAVGVFAPPAVDGVPGLDAGAAGFAGAAAGLAGAAGFLVCPAAVRTFNPSNALIRTTA